MQVLDPGLDTERFFAGLASAQARVLLLDYDGTLAPFRVERDQAAPYSGVRDALAAMLQAGHTRLVVISGRKASELPGLLRLTPQPEIWGTHGWERLRPDGAYSSPQLDTRVAAGLAAARAWADWQGLAGQLEEKPASVALHWRGLPPELIAELRAAALACWSALVPAGLEIHSFDGGIELRVPGRDKGFAVRTILGETRPDAASIAYLGDDLTDEDAFAALAGRGLGILVRAELRPTKAALWLRPPEELIAFLWRWQRACLG
jgi:trehalose-phosphatase